MSPIRLAGTAGASLLTAAAAVVFTAGYLPLNAQPRRPPPPPPSPAPGLSRVIHSQLPIHVKQFSAPMDGTVTLEVTSSPEGETLDVHVSSGPDALRRRALTFALTSMLFSKELAAQRKVPVTIEFIRSPLSVRMPAGAPPPPPPPPPSIDQAEYQGTDFDGLDAGQLQQAAAVVAPLSKGQRLSETQLEDLERRVQAIDRNLRLTKGVFTLAEASTGFGLRLRVSRPRVPTQIRVGGASMAAQLIEAPPPVYPPLAQQARIQGTVRFDVTVGEDGKVAGVQLVSGHPLLVEAARTAVMGYRYRPLHLNGRPVSTVSQAEVHFTLP